MLMAALADPPPALEALARPRLSAIGRLAGELRSTVQALARLYGETAARTRIPDFRAALERLAAAKAAHVAVLDPFVEALGRLVPQTPPPEPPPAPYEPEMLRLSEIMGSLAFLRSLCTAAEAAEWPQRMQALIEEQAPDLNLVPTA